MIDDPGVIDLALAHACLKLAGRVPGIAKMDVLDVGENAVEVDVWLGSLEEMAGVQCDSQSRDGLAEEHRGLGVGGQGFGVSEQREHEAFTERVGSDFGQSLDLVIDRGAARCGVQGDDGDAQ